MTMTVPLFDLDRVPFSRMGSYMTLTKNVGRIDHPGRDQSVEPGVYLCDVSGSRLWRWNGVFLLVGLTDGQAHELDVDTAQPDALGLVCGGLRIEATWDGPDTMRLRGTGGGLRLIQSVIDPFGAALAFASGENSWRLQMGEDAHYVITRMAGGVVVDAPNVRTGDGDTFDRKVIEVTADETGAFEIAITQYESGYRAPHGWAPFDEARQRTAADFEDWAGQFPALPGELVDAGRLAAYVQWSSIVAPRGIARRSAMLMSKNWMNAVWSWDHCFNAIGLADSHPDLAWDQYMLPFDHQHAQGSLPDLVHDNGRMWGFAKPPVHGWALLQLLEIMEVPASDLVDLYPRLQAWTQWWLTYRDDDHDGLCEYHHGCDSGQDNSAAFDAVGFPCAAPDLAAFLILQMDALAEVARRIGRADEAESWVAQADRMLDRLLARMWDGDRFAVVGSAGVVAHDESISQLNYLPLVLGDRLPPDVRDRLVESFVASGLITPFGIASESPQSPLYEADGYWRGPIWAPTTLLLVHGLRSCARVDVADQVARSFLDTCALSGFAENYEATSARPLRDNAYSWSASVFWSLARLSPTTRSSRATSTAPRKEAS